MNIDKKIASLLMITLILLSASAITIPRIEATPWYGKEVYVRVFIDDPYVNETELGDGGADVRGTLVDVAVVIENATYLWGFDIRLSWDTEYLDYVSHTFTWPVTTYSSPIDPSPYAGVLYEDGGSIMPMPGHGLDAGAGLLKAAVSCLPPEPPDPPMPSFNGSGTVFVVTLELIKQQFQYEGDVSLFLNLYKHDVAAKSPPASGPVMTHTAFNGLITLHGREFEYPPLPLLKVMPENIEGYKECENFTVEVWLMAWDDDLKEEVALDAFWDPAGFDMVLNFNKTLIEAVDATIDPVGWWAGFWPGGTLPVKNVIDNAEGTVDIAFVGAPNFTVIPGLGHTPASGMGVLFNVTFHAIFESEDYPPPCDFIWLENPLPEYLIKLYAEEGVIELDDPVCTQWHELWPDFCEKYHFEALTDNGDGKLSPCDQIRLRNKETNMLLPYHVEAVTVLMNATSMPFNITDHLHEGTDAFTNLWPPINASGYPEPFPIGWPPVYPAANISLRYTATDVHTVHVDFKNGTERDLVYGSEWEYFSGTNIVEIRKPLGIPTTNCFVEGVNLTTGWLGWVPLGRVMLDPEPTGWVQRFRIEFPSYIDNDTYPEWEGWNGTSHVLLPWNEQYDWMFYYFDGNECPWGIWGSWGQHYAVSTPYIAIAPDYQFPPNTTVCVDYLRECPNIFVNYTATLPPLWVEFMGDIQDFPWDDPVCTQWHEDMPVFSNEYHLEAWTDGGDGLLSSGDVVELRNKETNETTPWNVDFVATAMIVKRKPVVCDEDPTHEFYGMETIVDVAGFPHPEYPMCPWHGLNFSIPLPHVVQNATYCASFKPPGRWIDLYLWGYADCHNNRYEYGDEFKGFGPNEPADALQPQAKAILQALVTYNLQPTVGKCVTFEIISPTGEFHIIRSAHTDLDGIAEVIFTIPWPYPDPEGRVFGEWCITATVDIVKVVINDTLCFEVGYEIELISVIPEEEVYKKGEHMTFTVTYTSISHQDRVAYFTLVVYDELLVPFAWMIIGPVTVEYGTDTLIFTCMEVPHWVFRYKATVYANALTALPQDGGVQYCPEIFYEFGIE